MVIISFNFLKYMKVFSDIKIFCLILVNVSFDIYTLIDKCYTVKIINGVNVLNREIGVIPILSQQP